MRTTSLVFAVVAILTAVASAGTPDAKTLGVPIYPGARYDDELGKFLFKTTKTKISAAFTTVDAVEKVAQFYRQQIKTPADWDASLGWFVVTEDYLEPYWAAFATTLEAASRKKVESVVAKSKGKKLKLVVQEVTERERIVGIQRPFLNARLDPVEQTLITIQSFK